MQFLHKTSKITSPLLLICCLAGLILLQHQQYEKIVGTESQAHYIQEEKATQVFLKLQKHTPTIGFRNLVADWNFLQFVQYFGDSSAREETGYSLVPDYFELISQHDPYFTNAYFSLSTANSLFAGQPQTTVSLLEKVLNKIPTHTLEELPNAYLLWNYKAVDETLFLGDLRAAQNSYEIGAEWAEMTGKEWSESEARRMEATAQFLATNPDSQQVQINAWFSALSNATDNKTKQRIIQEIEQLGGKIVTREDGRVRVEYDTDNE